MKELIDINDEIYRHAKDGSEDSNDEWNAMRAIANGTPISNNVTNGDVIKAMFPDNVFAEDEYEDEYGVTWIDIISDDGMTFEMDWWNAPYQKNDEILKILSCNDCKYYPNGVSCNDCEGYNNFVKW